MIAWIHRHYETILMVSTVFGLMGVFYSTAITTAAIIIVSLAGLSQITTSKLHRLFSDRTIIPLCLVFLVVLMSRVYSHDMAAWGTAVRVKLPFLILPLAYFFGPDLSKRFATRIHYCLVVISVIVGLPVLFIILRDIGSAVDLISVGKSISTPIEHVKYSMTVAYAAVAGWILYSEDDGLEKDMRRWMLLAVLFLVILLHLMAVRTGLVILYVSFVVLAGRYALQPANRKLGFGLLLGLICIPIIATQKMPTLKQKIGYMKHDWSQYQKGEGNSYSDSERMLSYRAGLSIFKDSPWIGVSYGDVRGETRKYYTDVVDRPSLDKLPHCQFLTYLAGVGIIGFLTWLYGFYRPLIKSFRQVRGTLTISLILMLYLNYSLSFLVENSLDRSISVAFFLLLVLPLLKGKNESQ